MECPACHCHIGYFSSFKIVNPMKHTCTQCGAVLSAGQGGKLALVLAVLLGLGIAGMAIYMEIFHNWTSKNSYLWFAVSMPLVLMPFQYLCWRTIKFRVRQ